MLACWQLPSSETLKMKHILTIWSIPQTLSYQWAQMSQTLSSNAYRNLHRTFMEALFITGRTWMNQVLNWQNQDVLREVNRHIDWTPSMQQDVLWCWKDIWEMEPQRDRWGTLSAYYSLKEANLEKWQSSGYQLPRIFLKGQTTERVRRSVHSQEFVTGLRGWSGSNK